MSHAIHQTASSSEQYQRLFAENRDLDPEQVLAELDTVHVPVAYSELSLKGKLVYHFLRTRNALQSLNRDRSFYAGMERVGADERFPLADRATRDGAALLSEDEVRFFQHYGVLGPYASPFETDLLDELSERARRYYDLSGGMSSFPFIHLIDGAFLDVARQAPILQRVQSLLGADVDLIRTTLHVKEPGSTGTVWHYDSDFSDGIQVWIALEDAGRGPGCMRMVPRSFVLNRHFSYDRILSDHFHLIATLPREDRNALLRKFAAVATNAETTKRQTLVGSAVDTLYRKLILRDETARRLMAQDGSVYLPAERGEYYVFAPSNHHCGMPNRSTGFRIALTLRYAAPDTPLSDMLFDEMRQSEGKYRNNDMLAKAMRVTRRVGEQTGGALPLVRITPERSPLPAAYVGTEELVRIRDEEGFAIDRLQPATGAPLEHNRWRGPEDSHR